MEPAAERIDKLLHAATERGKGRSRAGFMGEGTAVAGCVAASVLLRRGFGPGAHLLVGGQHAAGERAVLGLHLGAEVALYQRGHGLVFITMLARGMQKFKAHAHLGGQAEETGHRRGNKLGGDQKH